MDEAQSATSTMYWCHMCTRRVDPVIELETIECPLCQSGFIEQMSEPNSDNALSLWTPVLLGMMSNPRRRSRFRRRLEIEYEDNDDISSSFDDVDSELDRELQSFIRTRRRNSASILQFLQGTRGGTISELRNSENESRDRNRVILINSSNQAIIFQTGDPRNRNDISRGLDLLMQHLAENDPNRYGTPPAKKEDIEAMPMVKIEKKLECSVCLNDLEMGTEAKEMPCQHKFHSECILPWLELHSSCPVCRYELSSDGPKIHNNSTSANIVDNNNNMNNNNYDDNSTSNSGSGSNIVEERSERSGNRRGFFWNISNLFSSSGRGSSSSSTNGTRNASSTDEN